jgi:hypothetical protein
VVFHPNPSLDVTTETTRAEQLGGGRSGQMPEGEAGGTRLATRRPCTAPGWLGATSSRGPSVYHTDLGHVYIRGPCQFLLLSSPIASKPAHVDVGTPPCRGSPSATPSPTWSWTPPTARSASTTTLATATLSSSLTQVRLLPVVARPYACLARVHLLMGDKMIWQPTSRPCARRRWRRWRGTPRSSRSVA